MSDRSGKIEEIKRYIDRTNIPQKICSRYEIYTDEWEALCREGVAEAVALAFEYGQAKGYRAAAKVYSEKRGGGRRKNCWNGSPG